MIYGFVGSVFGSLRVPIRGNGKTISMTYWMNIERQDGREVFTNYHTTFSTFIDTKEVAELIFSGELGDIILGIDEIQKILENIGRNKYVEFMGDLVNESRKDDVDIFFTTQRFKNLVLRFREQVDRILVPKKYHVDTKDFCDIDKCKRIHFIMLYDYDPFEGLAYIGSIDCVEVGKLYDTRQRIKREM